MDSRAQRKALFRSRLKEASQKRDKRIDSPLVRYNEDDQPVCRVCNIILKSESLWLAHQASRKHHEAIENIKADAAARQTPTSNPRLEKRQNLHGSQLSTALPGDFVDSSDVKRQKTDSSNRSSSSSSYHRSEPNDVEVKAAIPETFANKETGERNTCEFKQAGGILPSDFFERTDGNEDDMHTEGLAQETQKPDAMELKQVKGGALPAGFFDNKDADLRARGIEPVRVDVEDAYKEFEKEIHEDLKEVDDRMEEDEVDAAEVIEEIESLEQKAYRERVEMMKKKLIAAKESRELQKSPASKGKESSEESSGDEGGDDEDFTVDWRAKRL